MSPHNDNDNLEDDDDFEDIKEEISDEKHPKIFSKKRREGQVTSRLGNLMAQKVPVPMNYK
jgi:hypothetical protein